MSMDQVVKWEKQEGNKGLLTVEVPAEEVTRGSRQSI